MKPKFPEQTGSMLTRRLAIVLDLIPKIGPVKFPGDQSRAVKPVPLQGFDKGFLLG